MFKFFCLFFLGLIFLFPQSISAGHTVDDSKIQIIQNPNPVLQSSGNITITVKSTEDFFSPTGDYTAMAWNIARGEGGCNVVNWHKPISATEFTVTWDLVVCRGDLGKWKFQLWLGGGIGTRNDQTLIVKDYQFEIEQEGGQLPVISPLKSPLLVGTQPSVILSNARAGNTYAFWWEGAQTSIAAKYNIPTDNTYTLSLIEDGTNFSEPGKKTLCMEIGIVDWYVIPQFTTCRFKTEFEFTVTPPPTNLACELVPTKPTINDDINLKGINLPQNTDFRGELTNEAGTVIKQSSVVNSGSSGTVVILLASKLEQIKYKAVLYNASTNTEVCRVDVQTALDLSGQEIPKCEDGGIKCSKVAAEPCADIPGEGIMTAIGCVPTEPTALVNGIIRFLSLASGAITLLILVYSSIKMITAEGNPDTIKEAQGQFSAAIIGLLFIIFSVLLLQIIGVNILGIPGFQ
ncbi:hypothetical protein HYS91_01820 [Candidatus Daviesbacteria bacterium]|nr:hypothetical protein [Candidatus Daviesbacteria bacterium]